MAEIRNRWMREVGIPTALFVALLGAPWCFFLPIGSVFALVALVIVPPIWGWIVRGRTDEPIRGAWAGLFIGPLVHIAELLLLLYFANGPMRGNGGGGLGGLAVMIFVIPMFVLGVASVAFGPLMGLGIIYFMRRFSPRGTTSTSAPAD